MPDEELLPTNTPATAPVAERPKKLRCENCECALAPNGDVMSMSDKARALRDQAETIDRLTQTIAKLETAVADALRLRDEARALVKPSTSGITW